MRYSILILVLSFTTSAWAGDTQRNVVGKLTSSAKPQVRVMSTHERTAASENLLALNLDFSPDQVVCQEVKVGPSSRLKVQRCKTRAQFREEAEQRFASSKVMLDRSKYSSDTGRQLQSIRRAQTKKR